MDCAKIATSDALVSIKLSDDLKLLFDLESFHVSASFPPTEPATSHSLPISRINRFNTRNSTRDARNETFPILFLYSGHDEIPLNFSRYPYRGTTEIDGLVKDISLPKDTRVSSIVEYW